MRDYSMKFESVPPYGMLWMISWHWAQFSLCVDLASEWSESLASVVWDGSIRNQLCWCGHEEGSQRGQEATKGGEETLEKGEDTNYLQFKPLKCLWYKNYFLNWIACIVDRYIIMIHDFKHTHLYSFMIRWQSNRALLGVLQCTCCRWDQNITNRLYRSTYLWKLSCIDKCCIPDFILHDKSTPHDSILISCWFGIEKFRAEARN